jgi:membrane protease YdiL (CAAX protease family)
MPSHAQLNQAVRGPGFNHPLLDLAITRLLIFGLALAGTAVVATIVTRLLVPAAPSPLHQFVLLKNLLLPIGLLAVYAWTVRLLERRRPLELALRRGIALLAAGLLIGMTLISAYVLIMWTAGAAHVTGGTAPAGFLSLCNEILVPWLTAVGEELVFRAVLFRLTEEMLGTAAAVLISAALFGLSHAANPQAGLTAPIALALGVGTLLALCFAASRSLWLPIGLHMGWNIAEGFIYGLPDSGVTDPVQLAQVSVTGRPLLTGGAFGPEGSVILTVLCMLVSAILLWSTLRTRRWTSMRLQLRQPAPSV